MTNPTNWNATAFFENLTQSNRLATDKNFVFCRVSGLEGFEEALGEMQTANNFVCVSDIQYFGKFLKLSAQAVA